MEPEFETELCDLKIEGGNQGDLFLQSDSTIYVDAAKILTMKNWRWRRKERLACASGGDSRGGDAGRRH